MVGDLLITKLYIPSLSSKHVPRPHLIDRLNQGVQSGCKFTLVSATAGFGKSTLIAEWLSQFPTGDRQLSNDNSAVAWLSLDEGDNDPARFLTYIVAALQKMEADIGEAVVAMLGSPEPPPIEAVLTLLLNDIATLPREGDLEIPRVLVLDDYHLIKAQVTHDSLTFLLENMPPNLHLVIISRSDPPLPLSRFRVRGQLTEIRQEALRFTASEADSFLNEIMGLSLSAGEVESLESRTEGWIAGLQLAAISMRGRDDIPQFIASFSGSHRFVMDYLADEVLQQQEAEIKRFLYQTVILNRMTAALCDAVTGRDDSQAILRRLEQDNLFIIPLDEERRWFRYHRLFADLLWQRPGGAPQTEVSRLHRRAARWYEQEGYTVGAIDHWLAAAELTQAARLMEANALDTLNRGEMFTLSGWLALLPPGLIRSHPWLCLARAWNSMLSGQVEGIETDLQDAARVVVESGDETSIQHVLGHVAAIQAYLTLMMGGVPAATQKAQEALEKLPMTDASTRSVVTYTLGGARLMMEDIEGACQAFAEAGATGKKAGNIHLATSALSALGMLQVQCSKLHPALETFNRAKQIATLKSGPVLPVAASAYNGKGLLAYEWDDLGAASTHLETAVDLADAWGNADSQISSCALLARVRLAQGDLDSALSLLQKADQIAGEKQLTFPSQAMLAALCMQAWLAKGDLAGANRLLLRRGLTAEDDLSHMREVEYLAWVRLLLVQNEFKQAEILLGRLLEAAETAGRLGRAIEILALQAVTLQALNNHGAALLALERALNLAEPEGYVRSFLDAGPEMKRMLELAADRDIRPEYTNRLLAALSKAEPHASPLPAASKLELIEPLTNHEQKVLRLIAAGLSNREVAEELYLSVNTVKWHLKNIYDKLDVHSRVAAVTRAQELDLL